MRVRRTLVAAALIATLMVSCGDDDDEGARGGQTDTPTECPANAASSTLTMGVFSETSGLDPTVSNGGGATGGTELAAIYDTLMRWDPQAEEYVPQVAEALEHDEQFNTWTLHLRDGVNFGNGDPLVAADVIASVDRHRGEDSNSPVAGLASLIASMESPDEKTVVFNLSEPWSGFPFLLAGPLGMITNPRVVEQLGAEEFNQLPVGAGVGPFEPVRFAPGEELVMKARDDYWAGRPCIGELRFVAITGGEATLDALERGEIDVAFLREPLAIDQARRAGYESHADLKSMGSVILINSGVRGSTPPTTDVRVRQAIAAALDPEAIDARVNDGLGAPGSAIFNEKSRWYQELEGPAHDPEGAKDLVEAVKAERDWDGSIKLICDNSPSRVETGIAVQGQLEAVGFKVDLNTSATISDLIDAVIIDANFELACWGLNTYEEEAWAPLADYLSTDGGANRSGYSDPAMDAALDALRVAGSHEESLEALADVQEIWNRTVPHVVLGASEEVIAWRDGVSGLEFNRDTIVMFGNARIEG
ncbi:MAG TPA: ABC transporter substrate-binding protein [Acidimicrobiales bacterium]